MDRPITPMRLGHVVINVLDLDRAEKFYTEVVGCTVVGKHPGTIVFLNFGQYGPHPPLWYHDLALFKVEVAGPGERRSMIGLNHVALQVSSPDEVDRAAERLRALGVRVLKGPETHKEDGLRYVYFEDPDHNVLEFICPTA